MGFTKWLSLLLIAPSTKQFAESTMSKDSPLLFTSTTSRTIDESRLCPGSQKDEGEWYRWGAGDGGRHRQLGTTEPLRNSRFPDDPLLPQWSKPGRLRGQTQN